MKFLATLLLALVLTGTVSANTPFEELDYQARVTKQFGPNVIIYEGYDGNKYVTWRTGEPEGYVPMGRGNTWERAMLDAERNTAEWKAELLRIFSTYMGL